jgi:hypothetical protein
MWRSSVGLSSLPVGSVGERVILDTGLVHLHAVTFFGVVGRNVFPFTVDLARVKEVLVKVIDKFEHVSGLIRGDADIVDHAEMLNVLAEAYTTCVRADDLPELLGHEHDSQHLVDASKSAAVNLNNVDGVSLKKLLEKYSVGAVLASRDAHTR